MDEFMNGGDGGFVEEEGEAEGDGSTAATIAIGGDFGPPSTTIKDPEALKALQAEEMAIAKADIECTKKHTEKVFAEVLREREQAFLDANPELAERAAGNS
jgi:hypothetical protein